MGNLLAYSGTATKIRGMRRKLLTAKDFQHLASLTSVSDAIGFLKTKSAYAGIFANSNEKFPAPRRDRENAHKRNLHGFPEYLPFRNHTSA